MLISVRWLGRHIDLSDLSAAQIAEALTLCTAEVEAVERFLPHTAEVLVGRVLERSAHPGADRLSLCKVDVGGAEPLPIVCGAPNVAQGQKVPVALPGVVLPGIGKLKKGKIRGEASLGMICSQSEIGLAEASDGIWVLPESCEVGASLAQALDLEDWVIDIDNKSLTHRPDLWGHRGIAGELAAIFERALLPLDLSAPQTGEAPPVEVRVSSPACRRYLAVSIAGAASLPSPLWLRARLTAVGQRSRGQLVDLSNFVMLDLGQPNHTFDARQLGGGAVLVRSARPKEPFVALDGSALELCEADMVIASEREPVALAGIIGGESSQVTGETKELLLEVATFDATSVRRTSTRHGVRTDSSARFEKSLDPELPSAAAGHYCRLLAELQPSVSFPRRVADYRRDAPRTIEIELRPGRVNLALGADLPAEQIANILERLGFGVTASEGALRVRVPSARSTKDIGIERDLVEEVGRLYGYGNIAERPLSAPVVPPRGGERRQLVRAVQDRLSGAARFTETISYSFQPDSMLELLGLSELPHCRLQNPVVAPESRIRRSLAPSLLSQIEAARRHRPEVRLYEVGKCYFPERANDSHEPQEQHTVGLLWAQAPPGERAGFRQTAFAQLHGVVADLLGSLERPPVRFDPASAGEAPRWAYPQRTVVARLSEGGPVVGWLSQLDPKRAIALGLSGRLASEVALAEISLDALLAAPRHGRRFEPLPRFPGIKVDVAIAVAEATAQRDVAAAIAKAAGSHFRGSELFDVYCGEAVGAGRKSLAYHVLLQSPDRTLSEKEEQKFLGRLSKELDAVGGQLRDG